MRIRIVQRPPCDSIDGIRLDHFELGYQYDVGNSLAALMLAEGWAEPVQLDEPALPVPFSETDPFDVRRLYRGPRESDDSSGSTRETFRSTPRQIDQAREVKRRRRRRK
jgi:hypothetical protein